MKKLLIPLLLVLTTVSCSYFPTLSATKAISYVIDSSVLVSSLVKMNDTVTQARSSINENKAKFSEAEWAKLEIAGDQIDALKDRFVVIFGNDSSITKRIMGGVQLKNIVGDVFNIYDEVEAIVLIHAEQFSEPQRLQVLKAKHTMDNLKSSYNSIKATASTKTDFEDPIDATETIEQAVSAVQKIAAVFTK